jgi:hypothetical protein
MTDSSSCRIGTTVLRAIAAALIGSTVLAGCGTATNAAAAPGIGSPVRDGQFEFTVTSVDRSGTAGDPADPTQAKGEFFNMHLTVKNTGTEARIYGSWDQKLIISGKQYDGASVPGVTNAYDDINPGLSIDTVVRFDIPVGAQPDAVQLHDSAFSGGITVRLK